MGGKSRASNEDECDEAPRFPASVTMRQTPHSLAMRNRLGELKEERQSNQKQTERRGICQESASMWEYAP